MNPSQNVHDRPRPRGPDMGIVLALLLALALPAFAGVPEPCLIPDNGAGTANLPPIGCAFVSLTPMMIVDGLAPGTTMQCESRLDSFFDITYATGGVLGGEREMFHGQLRLDMLGTGSLAGYFRPSFFDVFCEVDLASRPPNPNVQSMAQDFVMLQGQLPPGDPDFDLLRITAGSGFGLPSPGHVTLSSVAGGNWNVDSFFDITYRIDFIGAPGGPLAGRSGSTTGTIRLQCGYGTPVAAEPSSWGNLKALYR